MKWIETPSKGVRYREHPTRKHGKVKKDRYYAIRYQKDGKRKEEGLGWASDGWTLDKAVSELIRLKEAAQKGEGPTRMAEKRLLEDKRKESEQAEQERLEKERITFAKFMTETYLPQCKHDKKEKTYKTEEMLYRLHLAGTIGDLPLGKIAPFHLERIKKTMSDNVLSNRTIQYVLQLTRQAINSARNLGLFTGESPTKAVKWPKLDNMKLRYLSITESEKLLAALAAKSQNLHDVALLSLYAGLRFGEIAALTWSCVNWEAGTLAIWDAKTGSRTAYPTDKAMKMLKSRTQWRPDELIFPKRSGTDGSMAQASKVFGETVNDLKLNEGITDRKQKVTFHTLRHTYATHLYESTNDLYLTQRSLGHSTGTMTARYARMSENRLREGAAALEKAFVNGTKHTELDQAAGQVVNLTE